MSTETAAPEALPQRDDHSEVSSVFRRIGTHRAESASDSTWVLTGIATSGSATEDMYFIQLTAKTLDIAALTQLAADPRCGGVASFCGVTRGNFEGRQVTRLEYHCYSDMAVKQMRRIAELIFERFDEVHRVVVAHRLGEVPVTEASVVIIVASEHRASGLAAVAWAIDELKTTVPIWKREVYGGDVDATPSVNTDESDQNHQRHSDAAWKVNKEFGVRFAGATVQSSTTTTEHE